MYVLVNKVFINASRIIVNAPRIIGYYFSNALIVSSFQTQKPFFIKFDATPPSWRLISSKQFNFNYCFNYLASLPSPYTIFHLSCQQNEILMKTLLSHALSHSFLPFTVTKSSLFQSQHDVIIELSSHLIVTTNHLKLLFFPWMFSIFLLHSQFVGKNMK